MLEQDLFYNLLLPPAIRFARDSISVKRRSNFNLTVAAAAIYVAAAAAAATYFVAAAAAMHETATMQQSDR